jgi:alanine--tRNA ligase
MSGKHYGIDHETDVSLRVVTDHIRSVTFMISDGIMPSNSGRGYVLRRLLRRACRHGRLLGIEGAFLVELAQTVIDGSKDGYPELEEKKDFIFNVIAKEEAQFNKTIDQGLSILADMEEEMKKNGETVLSGENAFKLYDTYGFPIDLTSEILEEKGLTYDKEGFEKAQKEQRAKSEGTFGTHSYTGKDATVYDELDAELATEFVGYENLVCDAKVTALTSEEEIVDALSDGEKGTIIVDKTTFYGTMGGQEGDIGTIKTADGEFVVENTIHLAGTKIGHVGYVSHGMIKVGDAVSMEVDKENRNLSARNHSATHLLQAALRQVLGTHVEQAGSYVDAERLRFDFTHFSALSKEELKQVENIVNEKIAECLPVVAKNMPIEEARKTGAAALFGEKYGDVVRVVSMGDFSVEFCGGTHVSNTGVISALKIISETGVAAGVRRIEALTSKGLLKYYDDMEKKLQEAAALVKATPNQLSDKIRHLQAENKDLHSELESVKSKMAKEAMGDVSDQVTEVKGVKLIAAKVDDVDMNGLRDLGDQLKEKLGEGVIVLASAAGGKVSLVAMATDEAVKKGAHAGNLIKGIAGLVGGGGGGRPNMAQAGGKNPDGIDAAIAKVSEVLESQL